MDILAVCGLSLSCWYTRKSGCVWNIGATSGVKMLSMYRAFRDRSQKCKAVLYRYETPAQTITLPPPQRSTSCMQQATYRSPLRLHTLIQTSAWDKFFKAWFIWKQNFLPSLTSPRKMPSCPFQSLASMTLGKYWTFEWTTSSETIFPETTPNSLGCDSWPIASNCFFSCYSCSSESFTQMLKPYHLILHLCCHPWCSRSWSFGNRIRGRNRCLRSTIVLWLQLRLLATFLVDIPARSIPNAWLRSSAVSGVNSLIKIVKTVWKLITIDCTCKKTVFEHVCLLRQ
jgi:hypothetical protein